VPLAAHLRSFGAAPGMTRLTAGPVYSLFSFTLLILCGSGNHVSSHASFFRSGYSPRIAWSLRSFNRDVKGIPSRRPFFPFSFFLDWKTFGFRFCSRSLFLRPPPCQSFGAPYGLSGAPSDAACSHLFFLFSIIFFVSSTLHLGPR